MYIRLNVKPQVKHFKLEQRPRSYYDRVGKIPSCHISKHCCIKGIQGDQDICSNGQTQHKTKYGNLTSTKTQKNNNKKVLKGGW